MSIDPSLPIPLYFQLKTLLVEEMLHGVFKPGDRLPTEQQLCHRHGISRTPVTRALSELADEGVVLRRPGRGTFVNPYWVPRYPHSAEVRVVVPEEGPWAQLMDDAVLPGLAVNVVAVPRTELHHVVVHAVAEGQAPDLAVLDSVWVSEFAANGFLAALDEIDEEWVRREHDGDFLPPLVSAVRHDHRTYAVSAVADVAGLWYRRDTLDRLGLKAPRTWADLLAAAQRIAAEGSVEPIALTAGSRGGETTTYGLIALLAANGAAVLTQGAVHLDTVAAIQTLQFLHRLVDKGLLAPEAVAYDWNRPVRLLASGDVAFSLGGSYEAGALAAALGVTVSTLTDTVGFAPVPSGPSGPSSNLTGTMVYGIFRQAAHPQDAMRLLRQVVAPESLSRLATTTGRIPPRRSALTLAQDSAPFVAATAAILENAVTRPSTPAYPRVSAQLAAMLEGVLTGRFEPAAAVRRTAEMIGAITGLPVVHDAASPSVHTPLA